MAYYEIQGNYGYGWDCVYNAENYKEARSIANGYAKNEGMFMPYPVFRIVKRHEKRKSVTNN